MLATSTGDSSRIEEGRGILGENIFDIESENPCFAIFVIKHSVSAFFEFLDGVCFQFSFVGLNLIHADPFQIFHCCMKAIDAFNIDRPRFKTRRWQIERLVSMDVEFLIHAPADQIRVHLFQKLIFAIKNANPRGTKHFMSRPRKEIAI